MPDKSKSTVRRGPRVYTCEDCGMSMRHDDCFGHATRECAKRVQPSVGQFKQEVPSEK